MASTRKSRSLNKRFSNVNEESHGNDGGKGNKSRQRKRKLSDMLGSEWSKGELERFYEAYRKYGKDWKKVASVVRNRSTEMVEALYNMNRAYLSLPEGTASVVGLIAMMTDHYNILEGSDSERESNAPGISRKPQKRGRGKFQANVSKGMDADVPDLLNFPSITSNYGCLSLLKKRRSGGSRPRAVGKRTPRFPVSYPYDKRDREKFVSPNKRGSKSDLDAHDDEVAHGAVLALAEALQRGGSPQVSHTPNRRSELIRPSPVRNSERMQTDSEMASVKHIGITTDEDYFEGSLESREAENGDFPRDSSYMMDTEGVGTVEVKRKGKKFHGKKPKVQDIENNHFDDVREACSGTEEGLNLSSVREKVEDEVTDSKFGRSFPQGPRKRSRQLFFEAESSALDALYTLADVSLKLAPASTVESESSVQFKEEKRTFGIVDKSSIPETTSANHQDKPKTSGAKEKAHHSLTGVGVPAQKNAKLGRDSALDVNALSEAKKLPSQTTTKMRKQKRKSLASKLQSPRNEAHTDSLLSEPPKTEVVAEDGKKSMVKAKRVGLVASLPKQGKSFKPPERSSSSTDPLRPGTDSALSTVQVPTMNQVNLPTKVRSRRKMDLQKAMVRKEKNSPEDIGNDRPNKHFSSLHDGTLDLKENLSRCLSSQMLRRWCAYEWFYSAIDYPWFAKKEFVEYLNHTGLGHVPRLTRVEWGVIRSSLGKPRRLSQQFLREEKEKLEQYRESVRTHYTELRAGTREGLPTDLARPLSVGQRVIACHPRTREFHDGSVLTVDRNRCRIQFDWPELGVEFVMDIDCMPLNPLENMPEALRRQNISVDRLCENFNEPKLHNQSKDWKTGGYMNVAPSENPAADGTSQISSPTYPLNTLLKQAKGDTINAISQAKAAANEICNAQKAACTQPCTLAQIQAREADIRALSELTRALEKKEALVLELRHMNDEVYENQKDGDNSLKDYDPFKKQYATVLIQLKEANDQVSSALMYLRQRNTYQGNSPPWLKPKAGPGAPVGPLNSVDQSSFLPQESASHVIEILDSSRLKAQTMVDAAVQALSSLKEGEDAFARIGEALDSANNRQNGTDSGISTVRSFTSPDPSNGSLPYQDAANSYTAEPLVPVIANGTNLNNTSEVSEVRIPKELISSCVATFLMIQTCTERQYPPAEVAQILDSAVTSLQPCCSQNLPIYREIQMCMGLVKNQILALIPS
ncbi:SANT/Myb domain [Macleaya cordata]|uniref:SANT/Myb domain n=1 Tax=Macleaya cordata TaxID=56857 RepID=A0A200Q7S8_MACCD|nr:SANT/Myb domain [Macleaya cordata]